MSPMSQALLFALLGCVLGAGVVLVFWVSERQLRSSPAPVVGPLPAGVATVLSVLRSSAVVIDSDDVVLKASAPAIMLGLVHQDRLTVTELHRLVGQVRRDGQIRETEVLIQRRPGQPPRTVSARVTPLTSKLVLLLVEDRTRERRVESIRRDFVVNVSHELKTPVGAITLLADAVQEAADDPEAVRHFARRMHHESDRLARLVQQIIELSRLQDDDPLDEPAGVDLDEVLARVLSENASAAERAGIRLSREGDLGVHLVGSTDQIALAIGNLVSNAIRYSPAGGEVLLTAAQRGNLAEITVSDSGVGIAAPELERIFERFYRVDPARHRTTGGTGLGLSIVKHVVASHGGDVHVWSEEGRGSRFTVTLPRRLGARTAPEVRS